LDCLRFEHRDAALARLQHHIGCPTSAFKGDNEIWFSVIEHFSIPEGSGRPAINVPLRDVSLDGDTLPFRKLTRHPISPAGSAF